MAMKLFAHMLRVPGVDADGAATVAAADSRRWVFRDLVVQRDGYSAWGLSKQSMSAMTPPRESAVEPLWPDTQPWWHE